MSDTDATLIISDTHLAHPSSRGRRRLRPEHLRPLWQGVRRLVVAGDLAELQLVAARSQAAQDVEALQHLCADDGVELLVLSGNHDAFISDRRHLTLMNGQILVTHGDVLHPAIAPWARGAAAMRKSTHEGTERYCREQGGGELDLQRRLEVAQHVAHRQFADHEDKGKHGVIDMLRRPDRVAVMAWYWRNQPALGAALLGAVAPEARVLIFGHSHRPGVWHRAGRRSSTPAASCCPTGPAQCGSPGTR